MVNYLAFPVVDNKTKKVIDMMSFIDTELQMKKRILLDDLTRDSYA